METRLISTDVGLTEFKNQVIGCSVIAVDTEFVRTGTNEPILCLVQIEANGLCVIIDPLTIDDLTPLSELLEDTSILKIFHACDQDLDVLSAYGMCVKNIFDTQIAEMFLSSVHIASYESLVKKYINVRLSKLYTTSDWQIRPLSKGQQKYAINDILYLREIYQKQKEKLEALSRLQWAIDESNDKVTMYSMSNNLLDQFKLYIPNLTPSGIHVLKQILEWRHNICLQLKTQDFRVIKNDLIFSILKHGKLRLKQLKKSRLYKGKIFSDFLKFIEKNIDFKEKYVIMEEFYDSNLLEVIKYLKIALDITSRENNIYSELIATNDTLMDLVSGRIQSRLLSGWRFEVFGKFANDILNGKTLIKINNKKLEVINE